MLRDHRLRIMEGVLAWEGEIGNARVRKLFGLQPVQASRLLAEFRTLMGDQVFDDGRTKVIKPVTPESIEPAVSLDDYVRQTQVDGDTNPCIIDARVDLTVVRPVVFSILRKASMTETGATIKYASMTNPTFEERTIFPHTIIHIGRRWHVRAWCDRRKDFRDFTLGRIKSATALRDSAPQTARDDLAWNRIVEIRLAAHRGLSLEQQRVVRSENFNGTMGRRLPVRACLAQYVIQDLRAAVNPEKDLPPEFQIEITNAVELKGFLF